MLNPKLKTANHKLFVIVGPTASGKSALAVDLARKLNGEIVSADSRQIYKEMDIGTGKITKKEMKNIPHYLLDVASPRTKFSVALYRKLALSTIDKIFKKGKIPILCGGTAFYIYAVTNGLVIPEVAPDWKLRKKLEKKSVKELYAILAKMDPGRVKNIDRNNPRRLIRAIEIIEKTKSPIPSLQKNPLPYPVLFLGIKKSPQELRKRISKRVDEMVKTGLKKEVERLVKKYGWAQVLKNAIGYKEFRNQSSLSDIRVEIKKNTYQFAKRQMTWFKRDKRINWVKNEKQAEKLIKRFL